jgi:hypothetical protein
MPQCFNTETHYNALLMKLLFEMFFVQLTYNFHEGTRIREMWAPSDTIG